MLRFIVNLLRGVDICTGVGKLEIENNCVGTYY